MEVLFFSLLKPHLILGPVFELKLSHLSESEEFVAKIIQGSFSAFSAVLFTMLSSWQLVISKSICYFEAEHLLSPKR